MASQIVLTHADASTLDIDPTSPVTITWMDPSRGVIVRHKSTGTAAAMNDGYTIDQNNGYRVVTCTALLTAVELVTLNAKLLPNAIPTYDATDPKIVVALDGSNSFTILCIVSFPLKAIHSVDNMWSVSFIFTERTT